MCHTFHPTSEMLRSSNFRSRLGGIKSAPEMTNQLPVAEIHNGLGFQPGRVDAASEGRPRCYSPWVSSDFLAICNLSAVDFQERGFLISEDENTVDFDSCLLGHFRGGREKGEISYVVTSSFVRSAGIKAGLWKTLCSRSTINIRVKAIIHNTNLSLSCTIASLVRCEEFDSFFTS